MRDQWYGDDRDVLKWSTLVHLARRESVPGILHIAMYRASRPLAPLATAFGPVDPPDEVLRHFRDLGDIQRLAAATGLEIDVMRDLSLTLDVGECLVLAGRSGIGKSTLLKMLHGDYRIDRGHIRLHFEDGELDLETLPAYAWHGLRRDVPAFRR